MPYGFSTQLLVRLKLSVTDPSSPAPAMIVRPGCHRVCNPGVAPRGGERKGVVPLNPGCGEACASRRPRSLTAGPHARGWKPVPHRGDRVRRRDKEGREALPRGRRHEAVRGCAARGAGRQGGMQDRLLPIHCEAKQTCLCPLSLLTDLRARRSLFSFCI